MSKESNNTNPAPVEGVSNDELLALHTAQGDVIADQQKKIAELESLVADLKAAQPAAEAPRGGTVVKIGKTEYQVVHGIRTGGRVLTPAEIAADKKLCEQLIEQKSGALKAL